MATISQVNVNDLSYDFIDVKSRNILTEFYDGDKIILEGNYDGDVNSSIKIYNSTLGNSRSSAPSSKMAEKLIGIADRTGETRSWIEHYDATNGSQGMIIGGCHQEGYITFGGGQLKMHYDNILNLSLDANCNPSVLTASDKAWRRALGFHDDINTATISEIITPSSGITIVDAHYIERFNVAMLYLHFKYNQAISVPNHGNITNVNIGTLVAGKRPCHTPEACSNGDEGGAAWYHIETNGLVTLCGIEGMSTTHTIAANTQFNLASTYLVR